MDDRFDFQLVTTNLNDAEGVAYIANSYQAFGNNGTHNYNQPINSGGNTAQPADVLDALAGILDHLPVVVDYQLPAKMSVSVGSVPSTVIAGAAVPVNVTVTNSAPVSFSNGADETGLQHHQQRLTCWFCLRSGQRHLRRQRACPVDEHHHARREIRHNQREQFQPSRRQRQLLAEYLDHGSGPCHAVI